MMRTKGLSSCDEGLSQLDLCGNLNKGMGMKNNLMNYYLKNLWHVLESCLCSHFVPRRVQLARRTRTSRFGKRRNNINTLFILLWFNMIVYPDRPFLLLISSGSSTMTSFSSLASNSLRSMSVSSASSAAAVIFRATSDNICQ